MTKSCKSQGRKNKTMKKNTKKMQGGLNIFGGPHNTSSAASQVPNAAKDDPIVAAKDDPIVAVKDDPNAVKDGPNAVKDDSNITTTTAQPESQNPFFSFKFPSFFSSSEVLPTKKGGKRKSKSNKSYKKKSKYNKK